MHGAIENTFNFEARDLEVGCGRQDTSAYNYTNQKRNNVDLRLLVVFVGILKVGLIYLNLVITASATRVHYQVNFTFQK